MTQRKGSVASTSAVVLALIALAVAIGGIYYNRKVAPDRAAADEQNTMLRRLTGIDNQQVANAIEAPFVDADGDLVADPAAADRQIDPPTLSFSYIVTDDQTEFKEGLKDLVAALSKATGKPVEFVTYDNINDKLRDMRDGKLQIAGWSTGGTPLAVCVAGFVPVSQLGDGSGTAGYHMQIIATPESDITKLADLRGRELTLTEPSSNSGYRAPLVMMRENGMRPATDYLLRYSQGQTQSIEGVKAKRFEAAAVADDVLKREAAEGKISPTDYKVIYTSDQLFPGATLGYSSRLKPELAAKIKQVLTDFDFKGTGLERLFGPEGKTKLVAVDYKKDFAYVRRIDDSIGFPYKLSEAPAATQPATQAASAAPMN